MEEQVARTAGFAVRVFSLAISVTVPCSDEVSKPRRPFLSDFFIVVRLLRRRGKFTEPDFPLLARSGLAQTLFFNVCDLPKARFAEGREEMPRPPPWCLREIADSRLRSLRQPPLSTLRLVSFLPDPAAAGHCICAPVYPVRAGLVSRPEDWRWSSYNEYAGMSAGESFSRRTV